MTTLLVVDEEVNTRLLYKDEFSLLNCSIIFDLYTG